MYISELKLDVRYYEQDSMAVVHHSNYIRYFECGRSQMMKELGMPMEFCEANGVMLPVVKIEIHYAKPAKLGDTLRVVTKFVKWPKAKIYIDHEIYNQNNELVCSGKVLLGCINSSTRLPIRVPEFVLDKLSPYYTEEEKNS